MSRVLGYEQCREYVLQECFKIVLHKRIQGLMAHICTYIWQFHLHIPLNLPLVVPETQSLVWIGPWGLELYASIHTDRDSMLYFWICPMGAPLISRRMAITIHSLTLYMFIFL